MEIMQIARRYTSGTQALGAGVDIVSFSTPSGMSDSESINFVTYISYNE